MITVNLTRGDVLKALLNSTSLDEEKIKNFMDREYPRLFFPLLRLNEFQNLKRKVLNIK